MGGGWRRFAGVLRTHGARVRSVLRRQCARPAQHKPRAASQTGCGAATHTGSGSPDWSPHWITPLDYPGEATMRGDKCRVAVFRQGQGASPRPPPNKVFPPKKRHFLILQAEARLAEKSFLFGHLFFNTIYQNGWGMWHACICPRMVPG